MENTNENVGFNSDNTKNEVLKSGQIIDRLKEFLGSPNDMKLSQAFKISQNTIYSWRSRNNADIGLIINKIGEFFPEKLKDIDYKWLLFGIKPETDDKLIDENNESSRKFVDDAIVQKLTDDNKSLKEELESSKRIISGLVSIMAEMQKKKE